MIAVHAMNRGQLLEFSAYLLEESFKSFSYKTTSLTASLCQRHCTLAVSYSWFVYTRGVTEFFF